MVAMATMIFLAVSLRPAELFWGAKPLVEDAYYSLAVARNIADGNGFTIDGERLTNGVQPLFTLVSALSFALTGSDLHALRIQLALHALIAAALGLVVARSAEDWFGKGGSGRTALLACSLYLLALNLYPLLFNGLETAFLLLAVALVIRTDLGDFRSSERGAAVAGLTLGVIVLIRVDAVFLTAIYSLRALLAENPPAVRLRRAAILAGTAFLVSSPWWAYNVLVFGSPMPLSGAALTSYSLDPARLWASFVALGWSMLPWVYLPYAPGQEFGWIVGTVGLGCLTYAGRYLARDRSGNEHIRAALLTVLSHGFILALWYGVSSAASSSYGRYMSVVSPAAVLLAAIWLRPLFADFGRLLLLSGVGLLSAAAVAAVYATGRVIQGNWHYNAVLVVQEYVPPEQRVAAGQSGTLGFFRSGVVNLDGKVNPEAFRHSGRIREYLDKERINWVVDWPYYIDWIIGPDPAAQGWEKVGERAGFVLYRRRQPL